MPTFDFKENALYHKVKGIFLKHMPPFSFVTMNRLNVLSSKFSSFIPISYLLWIEINSFHQSPSQLPKQYHLGGYSSSTVSYSYPTIKKKKNSMGDSVTNKYVLSTYSYKHSIGLEKKNKKEKD